MENKKAITMRDIKAAVDCFVRSVKMIIAFHDVEHPGTKDIFLQALINELEMMRPEKIRADAGVCKDDTDKPVNSPKPVNDLAPTAAMMCSEDYKERFKAEYYQTKIRYDKLHKMCIQYEAGTLGFTPSCELGLLKEQKAAMGNYLRCLEVRAQIEGISL